MPRKHSLLLRTFAIQATFAPIKTYPMEFMCALSVNGSLAYYRVQRESKEKYIATLKTAAGKQPDVPEVIVLTKDDGEWRGSPSHTEIIQGLVQAIEAPNRSNDDA